MVSPTKTNMPYMPDEIHLTENASRLIEHYAQEANVDPDQAEVAVHESARQFLASEYFKRSAWFRGCPTHVFAGAVFKPKGKRPFKVFFHLEKTDPPTVVTPDESPLDDEYHVQRVLAEVGVDEPDAWPKSAKP